MIHAYGEPIHILLIDDSPGDIRLTQEALKESTLPNKLHVVVDGDEALDFLHRRTPYQHVPKPDLILLDLNLPTLDGREVLVHLKQDACLKHIPVVVLTTSSAEEDIIKSYTLRANCYVTKPLDLDRFVKVIRSIEEFWFCIVKLPTRPYSERGEIH